MWKCEHCGEEIEDQFDSCWKCAPQEAEPQEANGQRPSLQCLRCQAGMKFSGTRRLHEGDWTDIVLHREPVDVYICPECGHIEFFTTGVGWK